MLERGLWAMVPRTGRSRWTQWASSHSSLVTGCSRAHAEVGGQPHDGVERVVGEGEAGMGPHVAPAPGPQEPLVLGQALLGAVGTVAVGDLVAAGHLHP